MMRSRLLEVGNLTISSDRAVIATNVAFSVDEGETLGIVGESGSGKSMTARAIMGLLPKGVQATGQVVLQGRELLGCSEQQLQRLRGTEMALVLQNPYTALNPLMRCGAQIVEMLPHNRRSRKQLRDEATRRLAEVQITDPGVGRMYPFQLSGGMRQRVALAAALARDPNLLIADEPTTALDTTTQREVLGLLKGIQEARGMAIVLITHDLRLAFALCDRVLVMYAGTVLEVAPAAAIDATPLHPYTLDLILAEPDINLRLAHLGAVAELEPTAVSERNPVPEASACPYIPRCRWAADECRVTVDLRPVGHNRLSACLRSADIAPDLLALREAVRTAAEAPSVTDQAVDHIVIKITGLTKQFDAGSGQTTALSAVDLYVGEGESVGLVGESGSGKTTLARCVVGLEVASSGSLQIGEWSHCDSRPLTTRDRRQIARTVQMVFQDPYSSLDPAHTIQWTLAEAIKLGDPELRRVKAHVLELLERVGLPAYYAPRKPSVLSGGERQRVAIARALALMPKVIVCDEAVSALDVSIQAQVLDLLKSLQTELGLSLLFISHDLAVIRQIADRVYVLQHGIIVEHGAADELFSRPQSAYTKKLLAAVPRADLQWLKTGPRTTADRFTGRR